MSQQLSDTLLSQMSDLLSAQTGLHFPPQRWPDLERGVVAVARALELPDAESCIHQFVSGPWTRSQVEILASHLTIGETYFFRHRECLAVLEDRILPSLIRSRRDSGRNLRVWCAGCCTGEEPYSIAILLHRMIPDLRDWNVSILATDINPLFLRKAREGVYREWSFRDTDPSVRWRYFKRLSEGCFEVLPEVKAMVTFAYLNLARDPYPSLLNGTNALDFILCRNVLMYFTPERAREVAGGFHRSLLDGGWLIVSPSEASHVLFAEFTPAHFPGVILYQRPGYETSKESPVAWNLSEPMPPRFGVDLTASPVAGVTDMQAVGALEAQITSDAESMMLQARLCANQGRLAEAAGFCEKAIAADRLIPARQYLLAAILVENGKFDEAATSLKRVLYLDQNYALAHFALGNLRQRQGRSKEAMRHFKNALLALSARSPEEVLPESDGTTAGRLTEIIEATICRPVAQEDR